MIHDSDSGIDSGISHIPAGIGIGIGINKIKLGWTGISGLLAGIGIGTGIRLFNFPGFGIGTGIKMYPESCITGGDNFLVFPDDNLDNFLDNNHKVVIVTIRSTTFRFVC